MARLLCELDGRPSIDLDRVGTDLAATLNPVLDRPLAEISPGQVLGALVETGTRTGVRVPRDLIVLAKQLLYFEHYATSMAPQWCLFGDSDLLAALFGVTPEKVERDSAWPRVPGVTSGANAARAVLTT
jgi:predicted unusual protein kinase regulating ubiquinone biosynthesis (AarF/ABC1/UbiB family)